MNDTVVETSSPNIIRSRGPNTRPACCHAGRVPVRPRGSFPRNHPVSGGPHARAGAPDGLIRHRCGLRVTTVRTTEDDTLGLPAHLLAALGRCLARFLTAREATIEGAVVQTALNTVLKRRRPIALLEVAHHAVPAKMGLADPRAARTFRAEQRTARALVSTGTSGLLGRRDAAMILDVAAGVRRANQPASARLGHC